MTHPGRLRVIAGAWRGRIIAAPADRDIRPTAARAREALFNRLAHGFADFSLVGARVVDVFAGSGVLGLEALSRGAAHAAFIEGATPALALINRNLAALGAEDRATVIRADARALPRAPQQADLAFLDPPYGQELATPALASLAAQGWLRAGALAVIETDADEALALPADYELVDRRVYGRAALSYARRG